MNMQLPPLPHRKFIDSLGVTLSSNLSDSCAAVSSVSDWVCEESMKEIMNRPLTYVPDQGILELREAIANLYQVNTGANQVSNIIPDDVVVFTGAQEAIFALQLATMDLHDEVVVVTPTFPSLLSFLPSLKIKVKEVKLKSQEMWRLDLTELHNEITSKTKLVMINFPNNPTGHALTEVEKKQLSSIIDQSESYLFSDEVSSWTHPLKREDWRAHSMTQFTPKAVSLGVTSKSFGIPGMRIGWLLVKDAVLREKLLVAKSHLSICSGLLDELLCIQILQKAESILSRNNKIVENNKAIFKEFCNVNKNWLSYQPLDNGITGVAKINASLKATKLSVDFAQAKSCLLLPGDVFYLPGNFVRIGFGQKTFATSLNLLESFLNTHHF
jgi:aspartate/methionine/tyrosine aminotransferase